MKPSSTILIIVILIISIIVGVANTILPNDTENTKQYTKSDVIVIESTQIENNLWEVTCEDKEGYIWSFFDDGTLIEGDIITLIMQSIDDTPENDEIIEIVLD